jgi:phosphoglucosamine mutase
MAELRYLDGGHFPLDEHAGAIAEAKAGLEGTGRIVVRPSGTEAMLRIMVEGEDAGRVSSLADALAELAAERLN